MNSNVNRDQKTKGNYQQQQKTNNPQQSHNYYCILYEYNEY